MAQETYNIRLRKGLAFELPFQWCDSAEEPISIAGKTVVFKIRQSDSSTLEVGTTPTTLGSALTIVDAALGKFTLNLTATETAAFVGTDGVWWNELDDKELGSGNIYFRD